MFLHVPGGQAAAAPVCPCEQCLNPVISPALYNGISPEAFEHACLNADQYQVHQLGPPVNPIRMAPTAQPLLVADRLQLTIASRNPLNARDVPTMADVSQISAQIPSWFARSCHSPGDHTLHQMDAPKPLLQMDLLSSPPGAPITVAVAQHCSPTALTHPFTALGDGSGPGMLGSMQPERVFTLPTGFSDVPTEFPRPKSFVGITKRSKTQRACSRWEAHIWVPDKKQQVYLGNFSSDERAATAYDIAALKIGREGGRTNFPIARYAKMKDIIAKFHLDDLVRLVRRQSQGFGRGKCSYRGVTKHTNGTWEARIGVPKKHRNIYIGLFEDVDKAAKAYDEAMMRMKGAKMSTNFLQNCYTKEIEEHNLLVNALGAMDCVHYLYFTEERAAFVKWIQKGGSPWIERLKIYCEKNRNQILATASSCT